MNSKDLQTFIKIQDLKLKAKINGARARQNTKRAERLAAKSRFKSDGTYRAVYRNGSPDYYDYLWVQHEANAEITPIELDFLDERRW